MYIFKKQKNQDQTEMENPKEIVEPISNFKEPKVQIDEDQDNLHSDVKCEVTIFLLLLLILIIVAGESSFYGERKSQSIWSRNSQVYFKLPRTKCSN